MPLTHAAAQRRAGRFINRPHKAVRAKPWGPTLLLLLIPLHHQQQTRPVKVISSEILLTPRP